MYNIYIYHAICLKEAMLEEFTSTKHKTCFFFVFNF